MAQAASDAIVNEQEVSDVSCSCGASFDRSVTGCGVVCAVQGRTMPCRTAVTPRNVALGTDFST